MYTVYKGFLSSALQFILKALRHLLLFLFKVWRVTSNSLSCTFILFRDWTDKWVLHEFVAKFYISHKKADIRLKSNSLYCAVHVDIRFKSNLLYCSVHVDIRFKSNLLCCAVHVDRRFKSNLLYCAVQEDRRFKSKLLYCAVHVDRRFKSNSLYSAVHA